jgi:hypothetical protein
VAVTAIEGHDGKPERLLSISRDITERKRLEEQQALVTRELHHRVKNSLLRCRQLSRLPPAMLRPSTSTVWL